jgi:hypothetical protein
MNNEAILILNGKIFKKNYNLSKILDFHEKFELNIKDGYLEENLLKNIESNKIKIFTCLNSSQNIRFIKIYVSKLWNLCRVLNYTRKIKDTDNNFLLLRLKDFLSDMFFLIFSSVNEITLHDIFTLIQMVTEVGTQWMKLELKMSTESWLRKIENILKFLITKINDVENLIHLERKFYINFIDYINFYLEFFLLPMVTKNYGHLQINLQNSHPQNDKHEEILKILILLKNIKFLENENSTRNLISNFLNLLKHYNSEIHNLENVIIICQVFDLIKNKHLLPHDLISDFYKFYIHNLINNNSFESAENVLKNLFELIPPNTKEEIECYLTNLEICVHSEFNQENLSKIKDIVEILFEHKEFTLENLEDLIILSTNYKIFDLILEIFLSKLKSNKVFRISNNNNHIIFNYENIKSFKNLSFQFVVNFFKSNLFLNLSDTSPLKNFFEILKILSECILENYSNKNYEEEFEKIITGLLKNVVILFLKVEKQNENFSSYFLLEIIKKLKNTEYEKEFVELSLEIYIEKKDFIKLKNMITEIEGVGFSNNSSRISSLFYYSNLILLIKEGSKWNSHNQINSLCMNLNKCEDFNIIFYLKIFNFILDGGNNSSNYGNNNLTINNQPTNLDFTLISIILQNFSIKFLEIFKNGNYDKLKYEDKNKNKSMSFFDIIFEILNFYSKVNNFSQQICHFVDFLNFIGNSVENENLTESSHLLTNNLLTVLEIINLLLNYKNSSQCGVTKIKNCEEYPEFILITSCKLLNFIFRNFFVFCYEFFNIEEGLMKDQVKSMMDIFELYKNLSIFYFSFEYANLNIKDDNESEDSDNMNKEQDVTDQAQISQKSNFTKNKIKNKFLNLQENFEKYQKNFSDASAILKNKLVDFNNKNPNLENENFLPIIEDKISTIQNSAQILEKILLIQILSKTAEETIFEDYIMNICISHVENKKFLFTVNSILYQNGFKILSSKLIRKILNLVISMFAEFVPKIYSIDELLTLFKDLINLSDSQGLKISTLKELSNIVTRLVGKIDDISLSDNIEWILYKIFNLLEGSGIEGNKINKNEKEFQILKQIYEELLTVNIKNKSYVLNNLFEIISKKLN